MMGQVSTMYGHTQDPVDFRAYVKSTASDSLLLPLEDEKRYQPAQPVPFLSLSELQAAAGTVRWTVKDAIPAESLGIIFGGSGTFKSFIALDLACHVGHGIRWLGRRTEPGPVLYIAAEGGAGVWRRVDAWHRARRLKPADCALYVIPVALDLGQECSRVLEAAKTAGVTPSLVVVDTLSQTYAGEENSANEVAAYLRELGNMLRSTWQASVCVIHHSGHQATERPRGSSAIRANVDWMLGVFRQGDDSMIATVECHKQKDGEKFEEVSFSLDKVELDKDEDGDPTSSLVATHVVSQEAMKEIVREQSQHGRAGYYSALIELAKDGMTEKSLRSAFYEACDLTNPDSRSKAYRRAIQWATKAGLVGIIGGEVRIFGRL